MYLRPWGSNILLLVSVISFISSLVCYSKVQKLEQVRRDDFASIIFDQVQAGKVEKFAVFLRPFYITGKLKVQFMIASGPNSYQTYVYELEETIIKAFKKMMPIVALGKPGEVQGVGRILVDEDAWRVSASELMRAATLIICIPSSHPGTIWELDEIINNKFLPKVVFLMPPDPSDPDKWFSPKWKKMLDDWNIAASYMKTHGIVVPNYRKDGLLFAVRPEIGCFFEKLNLVSASGLRKALLRLSSPVPSSRRWDQMTARQSLFARIMAWINESVNGWIGSPKKLWR
jgi:hypothetical protein